MACVRFFILVYLCLAYSGMISAQELSNFRKKTIVVQGDRTKIDTISIVPNSLMIGLLDRDYFKVDYASATLFWLKPPPKQAYEVTYRVLPFDFTKGAQRLSFDSVFYRFGISGEKLLGKGNENRPFDFGKINSNGSIGRSLSFGNRQDAVFNSSLNLQLNGYMGDSILLSAAISDNNIPIQPDGNTQNLNEFDRIFIQFSKDRWKLALGDLDIRQGEMYFLNFYKRLQGVSFQTANKIGKQIDNHLLASGAVAKGKFTRNIFQGIEGNQGPYRLKGANQELFFIVLAGTERVFIDGDLMQRGEDQDYVINYNTAEITFMPKQMITKDKRIQIEFEYADRNYLNAQFYLNNRVEVNKNLKLTVGYFGNNDSKNSPINQTLSRDQKQFLSSIGSDVTNAFYPSAVADTSSQSTILYRKVDTLVSPLQRDTVFVYAKNRDSEMFSVSFIDLGEGGGDYELDNSVAANGKVYRWVSPDQQTGTKRGRYSPVILLVAPRKQQLVSVAADWDITRKSKMTADLAYSKYDVNSFSSKSTFNENGYAGKLLYKQEFDLNKSKGLSLETDLGGEFATASFKPVERLRTVEFTRDWGLDLLMAPADEKLLNAAVKLKEKNKQQIIYGVGTYQRGSDFNALRNRLEHQLDAKGWKLNNVFAITQFTDLSKRGFFLRPTVDVSKRVAVLNNQEFSLKYMLERTLSRFKTNDSVTGNSFSFSNFQLATQTDPGKLNKLGFKYFTRSDQLPLGAQLLQSDRSHNYNLNGEWMSNEHHQFRFNATYRKLNIIDTRFNQKPDERILGRAEYFTDLWKGAITGNFLYEVGSGQEPRRDFTYFEVPAGQGEYTWIDYNSDGVQQINEFEVAKFRDQANYLRIFTPTNEFIKTDFLQFNYNFVFNPVVAISENLNNYFTRFLKKIYFQSTLQTSQKQLAAGNRNFNPIANAVADTNLVAFDQLQSHSLSYNKFSQVWGIDINYFQNTNRAFLSYGEETRKTQDLSVRIRTNWARKLTVDVIGKSGRNSLSTPSFNNRNFDVQSISIEPRITYTQGTTFRAQLGYVQQDKKNTGIEKAKIGSLQLETKYNVVANTSLSGRFTMSDIQFNGAASTSVGYIMLEGLQAGKNFIWNIDITKRLSSFIEMSIQYEGRKAGTSGIVNLGRAQIRAIL